jgi:hypothetical protein
MGINPDALLSVLKQELDESKDSFTDLQFFAAGALKSSLLKKFSVATNKDADRLAIEKFIRINNDAGEWSKERGRGLFTDFLRGHFKEAMQKFFTVDNRDPLFSSHGEILHRARTGPGSSLGATGQDYYSKIFSSNLTATRASLFSLYQHYISFHPSWDDAEKFRKEAGYDDFVVSGNKLSLVPKNVDISRTICTEPNLNMFFQLGVGEILCDRLWRVFGIDLSIQPNVNRELARIGSLDDRLCTIDLESASDSISLKMLAEYLPADIYRWLVLLRSPSTVLPDGQSLQLNMVSTMGNGFTFPLQTIIFSCVISACFTYFGMSPGRAGVDWSVFGDDIIVPREIVGPVLDLLEHLGFSVNMQKSFFQGPFRESCGYDYLNGHNVRGVYLKKLNTQQDFCVAINLLNRWSGRLGIHIPKTIGLLMARTRFLPVPYCDNDDAGIKVPLQLVSPKKEHPDYHGTLMYRRYQSVPKVLTFGDGVVKNPKGTKQRVYNPSGLLMAFLNGTIENGRISIRHDWVPYRSKSAVVPFWDYRSESDIASDDKWQRWETAVITNFKT